MYMRKFVYNKLVRDKVFDSMLEMGEKVEHKILLENEYLEELKKKIIEETTEIDFDNREGALIELADLQEVLDSIVTTLGKSKADLASLQEKKNKKSGLFKKRIFITTTELEDENEWIQYLEKHPDRYPEIKQ